MTTPKMVTAEFDNGLFAMPEGEVTDPCKVSLTADLKDINGQTVIRKGADMVLKAICPAPTDTKVFICMVKYPDSDETRAVTSDLLKLIRYQEWNIEKPFGGSEPECNLDSAKVAVSYLIEDMELLQSSDWIPDDDSIEASLGNLQLVKKFLEGLESERDWIRRRPGG